MLFPDVIQTELTGVKWLCPVDAESGMELLNEQVRPLSPFSEATISFLDDLYHVLKNHPMKREFPEVTTFAFFCRRSNLLQMRKPYESELRNRLGRGRVFHITPSNVPMNFAYSLVSALLAGNSSVIRVSSTEVQQVDIVIDAINLLLNREEHQQLQSYIQIIRYGREYSENTKALTALCDVRVIWGGDESIQVIRTAQLSAQSFDITFADRTSLAVIEAESVLNSENIDALVYGFYNDTYLNDQNACTSPGLIVWVGEQNQILAAKKIFWERLEKTVQERYLLNEISGVDKLATFMQHSVDAGGDIKIAENQSNHLWRVNIDEYNSTADEHRCNSGYFLELEIKETKELFPKLSRNYQTLAYFGFTREELLESVNDCHSRGIDRIVPIGRTQDFTLNWDGYDLIRSMSRVIS